MAVDEIWQISRRCYRMCDRIIRIFYSHCKQTQNCQIELKRTNYGQTMPKTDKKCPIQAQNGRNMPKLSSKHEHSQNYSKHPVPTLRPSKNRHNSSKKVLAKARNPHPISIRTPFREKSRMFRLRQRQILHTNNFQPLHRLWYNGGAR